jgi:hypothetical protein
MKENEMNVHAARMGATRGACMILVGTPEEKNYL